MHRGDYFSRNNDYITHITKRRNTVLDKVKYAAIERIDNKLDEIEVLIDEAPLLKRDKNKLIELLYDFYCDLEIAVDRYHEEWQTEKTQEEI